MRQLDLDLAEKSYPIYIGRDLISKPELFSKHVNGKQVMVVSDTTVAPLYLEKVKSLFVNYAVAEVILSDGEQYKTLETVNTIFDALLENHFDRSCTLVALGGGVVGDMTGFAAASYQRGVNFIQIPTTLLSQVDSSVGGKTGVNHALGKNMIGSFYQPKCVVIDIDTLDTLDDRQFSAGIAEVIKYGLLGNESFFNFINSNIERLMLKDKELLTDTIYQSCYDKADIVAQDEFESGNRALLNLGHTFGHAIENTLGYGVYLHGEAVAIGMLMAAELSHLEGYIDIKDIAKIKSILEKANLPTSFFGKITSSGFIEAMSVDKKVIGGSIRLVLLNSIGSAFICKNYSNKLLQQVIDNYCNMIN